MRTTFCLLLGSLVFSACSTPSATPPSEHADRGGANAQVWRATSRFGYGPGPGVGVHGPDAGRAWALKELGRAAQAAQKPAHIPPELTGFEAPLPTIFRLERESIDALRAARQRQATVPANDMQAMTNTADASMSAPPSPGTQRERKGAEQAERRYSQVLSRQAAAWRLLACSQPQLENPLLARMTEFWFNHLNVYANKGPVRPYVGHYVVHAIRPNALGRYEDLLLASAQHPAMLHYLDQVRSRAAPLVGAGPSDKRGLNENYARELLELHTLGVEGGYTQQDVRELARMLTGWTIAPNSDKGFRFEPRWHDGGDKQLLGQRIRPNGVKEGEEAIRLLARHPATARRISLRLAQWFVADDPPAALVQAMSQRYLSTQGDIRAVMQLLIESDATWAPEHPLFKTPMDYACSVLTALGPATSEEHIRVAARFLSAAGQPIHGWLTPDGYNTGASTWLSPEALARRADFAMFAGRALPDATTLEPWLPVETRARISLEPPRQRAGLALASPAYMRK